MARARQFHFLGDGGSLYLQGALKDAGKHQDIVHLIGMSEQPVAITAAPPFGPPRARFQGWGWPWQRQWLFRPW